MDLVTGSSEIKNTHFPVRAARLCTTSSSSQCSKAGLSNWWPNIPSDFPEHVSVRISDTVKVHFRLIKLKYALLGSNSACKEIA